jgi:hypothetical protein
MFLLFSNTFFTRYHFVCVCDRYALFTLPVLLLKCRDVLEHLLTKFFIDFCSSYIFTCFDLLEMVVESLMNIIIKPIANE